MPIERLVAYFRESTGGADGAAQIRPEPQGATASYHGMRLGSVFQPLLAADDLHCVAYEALLRAHDAQGRPLSPAAAFAVPATPGEAVYFDRLCRILHALNFVRQAEPGAELFLNVSGRHLLSLASGTHGETFEQLLGMCGLRPEQIILEVLEARVDDISHLNDAVEAYRRRGYRVAIDDFGCEHSNFDRLWRLTPDIVKLDRALIVQGASDPRARRILPKLIEIIHDLGATVVCEGIENGEQHALAIDAGADLVQGYYYARPAATLAGAAIPPAARPAARSGVPA
jgi:EAL domain-containing protein (putative c-di-GMP-specific phosphodiesterase class I)